MCTFALPYHDTLSTQSSPSTSSMKKNRSTVEASVVLGVPSTLLSVHSLACRSTLSTPSTSSSYFECEEIVVHFEYMYEARSSCRSTPYISSSYFEYKHRCTLSVKRKRLYSEFKYKAEQRKGSNCCMHTFVKILHRINCCLS